VSNTASEASLGTLATSAGAIELHYATPADADRLLRFARTLPAEDLFFLRRDITQPEEIAAWMQDIEAGLNGTILALRDDEVLGYSSVSRAPLNWIRHVAELRVVVAPGARGLGLGRALTDAAFQIALDMGVRKMIAQMTLEQTAAMAVFRRLGFASEALLPDHVIDAGGHTHDLLVMARRVGDPPGEPAL
jgi:L-amino acid N-acyltransferase YncA